MAVTQVIDHSGEILKFNKDTIIKVQNLWKVYKIGSVETIALKNASVNIQQGKFVAIIGSSGSGKSTLLHLLAGLDYPTKKDNQELLIRGQSLLKKTENWLAKFRAKNIGFVLQFFGLLPTLTTLENVMMAGYFNGKNSKLRKEKAIEMLKMVGLENRLNNFPNQLSGGQKQRVAIARALINEPPIIFADEPTGNLDSTSGTEVLALLKKLVEKKHITLVLVTHDPKIYNYADQIIEIQDGRIVKNELII